MAEFTVHPLSDEDVTRLNELRERLKVAEREYRTAERIVRRRHGDNTLDGVSTYPGSSVHVEIKDKWALITTVYHGPFSDE